MDQIIISERVLLADDRVAQQQVTKSLLKTLGYHKIDLVDNGGDILEALRVRHYDIILLKVGIVAEITSEEIINHINEQWEGPELPAIVAIITLNTNQSQKDRLKWYR